jgi:hypothetical protein
MDNKVRMLNEELEISHSKTAWDPESVSYSLFKVAMGRAAMSFPSETLLVSQGVKGLVLRAVVPVLHEW